MKSAWSWSRARASRPGYLEAKYNEGVFTRDGWFNSGDLGRIDADGYLWLTGRVKDVIIRGGHNIDPSVIEETLLKHADVMLAAAVSRPDAHAGELPIAYVQLVAGARASADDLGDFAQAPHPGTRRRAEGDRHRRQRCRSPTWASPQRCSCATTPPAAPSGVLADVVERRPLVDMVADPIKGSVARIRIATASPPGATTSRRAFTNG